VGGFLTKGYDVSPMIVTLSAGQWVATPVPGGVPELSSVDCFSVGRCVAVGWVSPIGGEQNQKPLVETLQGGTWRAQTLTNSPGSSNTGGQRLFSVSCTSAGSCVAVGFYSTASGFQLPLAATLTGGQWSTAALPVPADAKVSGDVAADLSAIDCPSILSCAAGGFYLTDLSSMNGSVAGALLETLSGGKWTASGYTVPRSQPNVSAVSCSAPSHCNIVGYDGSGGGITWGPPLLLDLSGDAWSDVLVPYPSEIGTSGYAPDILVPDDLQGISCAGNACFAVGTYTTTATYPLIESSTGGAWSALRGPLPGNSAQMPLARLQSVSCPSPSDCAAVGYYYDGATPHSLDQNGLIERLGNP
jgi:hypothetical protein